MNPPFIPEGSSFCGFCERPARLSWEHFAPGLDVGRGRCQGCGRCVLSVTGESDLVEAFLDELGEDPEAIMTLQGWSPGRPHEIVGEPGRSGRAARLS